MKLTIFAAAGGIGRQLLEQAIAAGHDVTAVARNPRNLSPVPARAVAADLACVDPAALQPAVAGADAVLSALGARTKADAGVAARGTQEARPGRRFHHPVPGRSHRQAGAA
jgi:putative NADH-flavin reductase